MNNEAAPDGAIAPDLTVVSPESEVSFADTGMDVVSAVESNVMIRLFEEKLTVSKREVVAGKVGVSTRTETHDDLAEITLDRTIVDVVLVPLVEERFVIVSNCT